MAVSGAAQTKPRDAVSRTVFCALRLVAGHLGARLAEDVVHAVVVELGRRAGAHKQRQRLAQASTLAARASRLAERGRDARLLRVRRQLLLLGSHCAVCEGSRMARQRESRNGGTTGTVGALGNGAVGASLRELQASLSVLRWMAPAEKRRVKKRGEGGAPEAALVAKVDAWEVPPSQLTAEQARFPRSWRDACAASPGAACLERELCADSLSRRSFARAQASQLAAFRAELLRRGCASPDSVTCLKARTRALCAFAFTARLPLTHTPARLCPPRRSGASRGRLPGLSDVARVAGSAHVHRPAHRARISRDSLRTAPPSTLAPALPWAGRPGTPGGV